MTLGRVLLGASAALSTGQVTFFIVYGWAVSLWLLSEYLNRTKKQQDYDPVRSTDLEMVAPLVNGSEAPKADSNAGPAADAGDKMNPVDKLGAVPDPSARVSCARTSNSMLQDSLQSGLIRCLMFDLEAICREREVLKAAAEFGTIMMWYFICDRTSAFQENGKTYSRDVFLFIFMALTAVAFGSSVTAAKQPQLLSRPQTEEWKGWMQVLFLLYHYFEAREAYNAIRIFIAAYVWMTGFGNFTYYYKTNDYCIGRFGQMMWRLNFLVFFVCLVMRNSYVLYYICPMHTIFTILVYASLGIAPHLNASHVMIVVKMFLCVGFVLVLWDIKAVFYAVWSPFMWLVGYLDPRKEGDDALYEWYFRSSLDRFVWIYGMLCAYLHPWCSRMLTAIDEMALLKRITMRAAILSVTGAVAYFWYVHIYTLPKLQYNEVHPYTSWIPITIWIVVRNMTPTLRLNSLRLYGWLGCITLETYISQFHIWLKTDIPDGQPKMLLALVPGYPLINFLVCSLLYVFISHRLFELTNTLKNAAVPHSNNRLLFRNMVLLACVGVLFYFTVAGLRVML